MSDRVEFYRDAEGQHRWRFVAGNGRILADSGQGYSRLIDCRTAAQKVVGRALCFEDCEIGGEDHPEDVWVRAEQVRS